MFGLGVVVSGFIVVVVWLGVQVCFWFDFDGGEVVLSLMVCEVLVW